MKQINYFMIVLVLFTIVSDVLLLDKKKNGKPKKSVKTYHRGNLKKEPKHRIIEGTKVRYEDYPFVVSLTYEQSHMCGGSIISDSVILTAAHCCTDDRDRPFHPQALSVAVGTSRWKHARHDFKVSKILIHEDFHSGLLSNDIGLWVLKEKLSRSDNVGIITLDRQPVYEDFNPVHATVLGWGYTSENGFMVDRASDDLLMVNIFAIPLSECEDYYEDLTNKQICFSSPDSRGSCFGDSGGPLVMRKQSKLVQIGLVSFGDDCNNTYPEVYTRISSYYMWIKDNVAKLKHKETKRKHNK